MKCPQCHAMLKTVAVKVYGATNKAISYQCSKCDYFAFEPVSIERFFSKTVSL